MAVASDMRGDIEQPRRPRRLRLPRYTVRLRLTLLYGGVFLLTGVALLAVTYFLVRGTTKGSVFAAKVTKQGAVVRGPHGFTGIQVFQSLLPATKGHGAAPSVGVQVTGSGPSANNGSIPQVTLASGAAGTPSGAAGVARTDRPPPRAPQTIQQAQAQARQLQALADQQHSDELHGLLVDLGIALAIMVVVSMGLGWLVAGRALRPLQTITRAARAISASNLHKRLSLAGPDDELRELGDTFDGLLERLERSFEAQRQFVANASHELRTPLTLERAIVEVTLADRAASAETLRATCERVLQIGEQQERMIDSLLALARSERGLERSEPFDLDYVVRKVVVARRPEIDRQGLRLESDLGSAPSAGDPQLVERLVANLIDNAVRHNAPEGWVKVSTQLEDGQAVLSVANSGPVVASDEVARLFMPFQRVGADRSAHGEGYGLGLSIVRAVAAAHGAKITAHARPQGGLEIRVTFASPGAMRADATERSERGRRRELVYVAGDGRRAAGNGANGSHSSL